MTTATLANLRHDASALLDQMPEGVLASMVALMKEFTGRPVTSLPLQEPAMTLAPPGFAAGEFVLPSDFDADNDLIADLFEGKQ
ncbi:MAG: hypothetical protein IJM64_05980 [Ottowia sp.]|nr:hypothetical protein [Ottowia sp.]